ncbi:Vta1 like-domain-containing protein [Crepidotus variabilis]|uniref:Vta1 like-domain-containing protein n=1 Tax=Crepidotus variabilis TaxID=179855 RepID=A0A9P6EVN8_9AGAR|nr:Vta1 like-domain-containing protein [Crepidotus variabilis]
MSSSSLLGLPSVPAELKPVLPYLQRADELKKQDAIVSYWCAYYAAQVGIGIKARDTQARDVLFQLLGVLEKMKADIGPHDAVDMESVSSAYVENFALRVFSNADNEDRSGRATRSTAKKFLAAANFLEVLKIFPKADVADSNDEKIRYAKWKAADIAKAFREGVKPIPGPPGWAEEQKELNRQSEQEGATIPLPPRLPPSNSSESTLISSSPPKPSVKRSSPPRAPHILSSSPPKHFSGPAISKTPSTNVDRPPESWSNAATPGTDVPDAFITSTPHTRKRTGSSASRSSHKRDRSGSSSHTIDAFSGAARGSLKKAAWTNEELEIIPSSSPKKSSFKSGSPDSDKRVRFSPPVDGVPPPAAPSPPKSGSPSYTGPESIYAPPQVSPPTSVSPSNSLNGFPSIISPPPSASSPGAYIYAQSPPPQVSPTRNVYASAPPLPPPPPPAAPFELTPKITSETQKHCRYAISALDYEDVATAKKELRAALRLLGA